MTSFTSDPLPSEQYNQLPMIEDCDTSLEDVHIEKLGKIFVEANAHKEFSLSRVHRHCTVDSDQVMVHRIDQAESDICRIEKFHQSLCPHIWKLDDRAVFRPYEFFGEPDMEGIHHVVVPSDEFLSATAIYLQCHQLDAHFAISRILPTSTGWSETCMGENATIATQISDEVQSQDASIVTEWVFQPDLHSDTIIIVLHKACKQGTSGGHRDNGED